MVATGRSSISNCSVVLDVHLSLVSVVVARWSSSLHKLQRKHVPLPSVSHSEWKLPLRGRITYRHCRQPKLPNFIYSSNTTFW